MVRPAPALTQSRLPPLPAAVEPAPAGPSGAYVGVIDLGSNSVRLVVAEAIPGLPPRVVVEEREPVRLGEGVFHTGMLNHAAAERTITALRRFTVLARARGVARLVARATCALREAEDRTEFLERVQQETGLEVQVLSGAEEARLIGRGILSGLVNATGEVVMVDVGGGSVEVARSVEGVVTDVYSLKLGAVRLGEMFLRSDPPSSAELELLRLHARQTVRSVVPISVGPNATAVCSAGTANALVALCRTKGGRVTLDALEETVADLARLPAKQRRNVPNLESRRADIIVSGGLALVETLRHLGVKEVEVTRRGLKEGLLQEAVEALGVTLPTVTEPERARLDGAMAVVRRYQVDEAHAQQVAALSVRLFADLKDVHQLGDEARAELEVAALLHDVGQFVSFERHHRHSAYLLQHMVLPGFSVDAMMRVAAMARYHRRGGPKEDHPEWAALSKADRQRVLPLVAILRVADALDRTHHHVVKDLKVTVSKKEVELVITAVASAEMETWAATEKADLFSSVFKRSLKIVVREPGRGSRRRREA